jgi:hypothetical protein
VKKLHSPDDSVLTVRFILLGLCTDPSYSVRMRTRLGKLFYLTTVACHFPSARIFSASEQQTSRLLDAIRV